MDLTVKGSGLNEPTRRKQNSRKRFSRGAFFNNVTRSIVVLLSAPVCAPLIRVFRVHSSYHSSTLRFFSMPAGAYNMKQAQKHTVGLNYRLKTNLKGLNIYFLQRRTRGGVYIQFIFRFSFYLVEKSHNRISIQSGSRVEGQRAT